MNRVLIVDDDIAVTNYLMVFLMQAERYESIIVNDSRETEGVLKQGGFDAILLDMDMPNISGIDILQAVHDKGINIPVIVLTGVSDVDLAVRAMKLGAFDYLTKPVDEDKLLKVLEDAIKHRSIKQSISMLPAKPRQEDLIHSDAFAYFPTQDPATIRLYHEAEQMANGDFCIFIWGERGTYKEMLARAIHCISGRKNGPFVSVDAAARGLEKFPAEFFGQARDWSGERADAPGLIERAEGGTLFLDEIDLLPIPMQVRLKRFIQSGEFYRESSTKIQKGNVRVIAASHHDLAREYYKDAFSRDLLYHLMTNSLRVPALHERRGDIPLLAGYFLKEEAKQSGKNIADISPDLIEFLRNYDFRDNVRELRSIIASAVINETGGMLTSGALPDYLRKMIMPEQGAQAEKFCPRRLIEIEREYILKMLAYFRNDKPRAAEALGMSIEEMEAVMNEKEKPAADE